MATKKSRNEVFGADSSAVGAVPTQNVMAEEFGWEVPTERVPIPSKGLVYPKTSPLYMQDGVDITAMTAREEDIITSSALIKKGTVVTELIRSCLVDKRVKVEDMLSGDRNAVMISIRITGYGQSYDAEIMCQDCKEQVEVGFDLASLGIKRLEIDPVEEGQNLFEFVLPKMNMAVHFKFLTGRDEQELLQDQERRRKKMKVRTDSLVTGKLQKSIVSVKGVRDRSKINHVIRNMPAADSRALRRYIEDNEPGIDMEAWVECERCGEGQSVSMPIGTKFFWPDM